MPVGYEPELHSVSPGAVPQKVTLPPLVTSTLPTTVLSFKSPALAPPSAVTVTFPGLLPSHTNPKVLVVAGHWPGTAPAVVVSDATCHAVSPAVPDSVHATCASLRADAPRVFASVAFALLV